MYFFGKYYPDLQANIRPIVPQPLGFTQWATCTPTWTTYTQPFGNEDVIENWKKSVTKLKVDSNKTRTTIPDVTSSLKTLTNSVTILADLHQKLSTVSLDESKELWTQVTEHKTIIDNISQYLCKSDVAVLKRKVVHNNKRIKKRKITREKEKKRIKLVDEKCSEWLKKKQSQLMRKKLEESVEKEASGSLGEVRKKIQDLDNIVNLIDALKKLREHRTTSKNWKIDGPTVQVNETFTEQCSEIENVISTNLKVYKDEEYALKVMMSEQIDAKMTSAASRSTDAVSCSSNDPIKDFYYKAEKNVSSFINIRQEWDRYLMPHGSVIPFDWVEPVSPSNDVWASYVTN